MMWKYAPSGVKSKRKLMGSDWKDLFSSGSLRIYKCKKLS